jgi:predicted ATPase
VLRASLRDRDRSLLVDELGSSGAELVQLIPEMREHLAEPAVLPALDAQQVRFRLFDAVATYLRRASNTQPLVILLDDLHWADKSSLLLLRFVARELRESKVPAIATSSCDAVIPSPRPWAS